MPTIASLEIVNFRSIQGPLHLKVPSGRPLVLIGENNAGKSNIVRALDMVLGQGWTGNHDPEDHEFYGRDRDREVEIRARFAHEGLLNERYAEAVWTFNVERRGAAAHHVGPSQYAGRRYDYMSNDIKSDCICVVIEADRNLNYHLSYASRWTFLSRLMHDFHKALVRDEAVKADLEDLFRQVKDRFEGVQPYAEFATTLSEQLTGFSGNMTHRLEVSFQAYNPVNFFQALRLHALEGDSPRTIAELGTGEQQILALAFAYAYANAFHRGMVLVIEEPEAHLHPLAQQWLAKYMRDLTEGGLQVVMTTHSPHFIDVLNIEGLVRVFKDEAGTHAIQVSAPDLAAHCVATGTPAERANVDTILPFYAAAATPQILEGFFAKAVILVEGPTEALAIPVYLERLEYIVSREGIAVIPVGGKGNLAKWRRLFQLYRIPTYVIFDNDGRSDDRSGTKRRDALSALGVADSEQDAILATEHVMVRPEFMVFPENFEASMRAGIPGYEDAERTAVEAQIESKPFVARWVAERVSRETSVAWDALDELRLALRALVPPTLTMSGQAGVPDVPQRRAPRRR